MVNNDYKVSLFIADLPLPRFVGLKSELDMRYSSSIPPNIEAQGAPCGSASGAVTWTPAADRSTFRHLEANVDKKVGTFISTEHHRSWITGQLAKGS